MATAPKFDSYKISPDACFTVDDIISKIDSQWDGTLLKHLHDNYNGKYGDSLLARIFLDFKLRDDLELFFKFILPKPEDYIYLVSTKTIDIFNLLINYYDQIKGQTTDGLVGSLATTFTSNENLVNYYFIVRKIVPDIKKIDVDFLKALRELVICCRVLITGGKEVSEIPYNKKEFIVNDTLLTTLNKMFQTIYFLCDYLNYKKSDFDFNNFINKILNASDTTNYAEIISIKDNEKKNRNEALSRTQVPGVDKYSYIRFKDYNLDIKIDLDKEFSNIIDRYNKLPYSFVLLDMIFEKKIIKDNLPEEQAIEERKAAEKRKAKERETAMEAAANQTAAMKEAAKKAAAKVAEDTLLDLLKAGFVDNTMLFLLSFKFNIKKHSDIYGIYGIIPKEISNKVDAVGDSATILTDRLQLLVEQTPPAPPQTPPAPPQTPPAPPQTPPAPPQTPVAPKLYLLNFNHFILKNLFYEIENNEEIKEIKDIDEIIKFDTEIPQIDKLKELQIIEYNFEDDEENPIEPENFSSVPQVSSENQSQPSEKEKIMGRIVKKISNFGKKLKNRKTYAFLNPFYALTKIMTKLIIKIIIPIIKNDIKQFKDKLFKLHDENAILFEVIDDLFKESTKLVNTFLSKPDIAQTSLNEMAVDSQNQALISLVEFLDEYSFFYLVSPIESKLLNQVIDLFEFPTFLTNKSSKELGDWDKQENKISISLNKDIKAKIESIKTGESSGDGKIISFENYFFLELTELRTRLKIYEVSLQGLVGQGSEEPVKKKSFTRQFTNALKKGIKMATTHSSDEIEFTEKQKQKIKDLINKIRSLEVTPPLDPLFTEKFNERKDQIEKSLEIPSLVEYYLSGCLAKNTAVAAASGVFKGAVNSVCQLFRKSEGGGTRKRLHNKNKNSRRIRTNKKKYKKIKSKRPRKNNRNRRTRKSRINS